MSSRNLRRLKQKKETSPMPPATGSDSDSDHEVASIVSGLQLVNPYMALVEPTQQQQMEKDSLEKSESEENAACADPLPPCKDVASSSASELPYSPTQSPENLEILNLDDMQLSDSNDCGETASLKLYLQSENQSTGAIKKTFKKKKNGKKSKRNKKTEEDDLTRALREVHQIVGEAERPQPPPHRSPTVADDPLAVLLSVHYAHLKPDTELTRLLGPAEDDEKRRRQRPNVLHMLRRQIGVIDVKNNRVLFNGITMAKIREAHDVKYFKFDHSQRYEAHLRELIAAMRFYNFAPPGLETFPGNTFEGHLQIVDSFFYSDRISMASDAMECAISCIQTVLAASFNYTDGMCRLEYSYVENRPFHVLLLKYLHLLTNKICHRTALEIAKLMLHLDPSDPLAVIFIIDTLAIRAREFQWLADIYPIWVRVKQVDRLFHMQFSHALAKYNLHLEDKTEESLNEATSYLEEAILRFPNVATRLMQLCKKDTSIVEKHEMHQSSLSNTSSELIGLQNLYCTFIYHKWREEGLDWLVETYHKLCANFHEAEKEMVKRGARDRAMVRRLPLQIVRHLSIITPMSQLLVDGAVPEVPPTISFNPYPQSGGGEDPRDYYRRPEPQQPAVAAGLLRAFVNSFMPHVPQDPQPPPDQH